MHGSRCHAQTRPDHRHIASIALYDVTDEDRVTGCAQAALARQDIEANEHMAALVASER